MGSCLEQAGVFSEDQNLSWFHYSEPRMSIK